MGEGTRTYADRRTVLKSLGSVPISSVSQIARRDGDRTTIRLPKRIGLESEILVLAHLPGVTVDEREDDYIVTIDDDRLRSPSALSGARRAARITSILQTLAERQRRYPPQVIQLQRVPVPLGEDFTLRVLPKGGKDAEDSGWVAHVSGSSHNHRLNSVTSSIVAGGGGGTVVRKSWIGAEFTLDGSGSEIAVARITGRLKGLLSAYGSGSASINTKLVICNISRGSERSKPLISDHVANLNWRRIETSIDDAMTVRLAGGSTYRAEVHLQTRVDVSGLAEAGSDFGPEDNDDDDPPQGLDVDAIQIEY